MNNTLLRKVAAVAASVFMCVGLAACTNYTAKFSEALADGQFEEAVSIYQQNEFKDEDLRNIGSEVEELLETKLDQYAKNEIKKKDLTEVVNMASKIKIDRVLDTLDYVKGQISKLDASKDKYIQGQEYLSNKDFMSAYWSFSDVIKEDAYYSDAMIKKKDCVTGYCDMVKERCAVYEQNKDYEGALKYLEEAKVSGAFSSDISDFIKNKEIELTVPSVTTVVDEYIRKNDYYTAFTYLESQIDEKRLYGNDQVIQYEETIISLFEEYLETNVDKFLAGNDYEGAIAFLDSQKNASTLLGADSWNRQSQNVGIKYVLSKAEGYVKDNDIASALAEITNYKETNGISENNELDAYAKQVSDEYVKMILERVAPLEEKEEYLKALTILSNAQNVVNALEFAAEIEKINAVKPIYLCDLKCANSKRYSQLHTGNMPTDTIGNKYELINLYNMVCGDDFDDGGFAEYFVGYRYKTLSGIVSINDSSDDMPAKLSVEVDGVQIFSISLKRGTEPTEITVDISNANWIKIRLDSECEWYIKDYDFEVLLSDFKFSEDGLDIVNIEPKDEKQGNNPED